MRMMPHSDLKSKWLIGVGTPLVGVFLLALMTAPNAPIWVVLGIVIGSSTVASAFYFHFLKEFARVRRAHEQSFKEGFALDHVSSFVMLIDDKRRIRYCNHALLKFFRKHEEQLSKALPSFQASHVVGESLDVYVVEPLALKTICSNLSSRYSHHVSVAESDIEMVFTPIVNEADKRLGIMVEWIFGKEPAALSGSNAFDQTILTKQSIEEMNFDVSAEFADKIATTLDRSAAVLVSAIDILGEKTKFLQSSTQTDATELNEQLSVIQSLKLTLSSSKEQLHGLMLFVNQMNQETELSGSELNIASQSLTHMKAGSEKVQKMVEVVDSIALKTHVLSLNAAVESARAGEHGKGFAVVANDARELARFSADTVNEVKQNVQTHFNQIENASVAMTAQLTSLQKMKHLVDEAKIACEPLGRNLQTQDETLAHTIEAFSQISKMITERFALTQQVQSMTTELTYQVKGILDVIKAVRNRFKIEPSATSATSAPEAVEPPAENAA